MATTPNVFGFFAARPRRRVPFVPTNPQQAAMQKALEEGYAALDGLNLPEQIGENFKDDLESSLNISTPPIPFQGAYPGTLPRLTFNIGKIFQDPVKGTVGVLWKYITRFGGDVTTYIDPAYLHTRILGPVLRQFADPVTRRNLLTTSTSFRLEEWGNAASASRGTRLAAERGLFEDPGLIEIWSGQLNSADPTLRINGVLISDIYGQSSQVRQRLDLLYTQRVRAAAGGDWRLADTLDQQIKDEKRRLSEWFESRGTRAEAVTQEFEFFARTLGSNTAAARLFQMLNNQRTYYQWLEFLKTFGKDGVWGIFSEYVWKEAIKRIFGTSKQSLRYLLYPPHFIEERIVGPLTARAMEAAARGLRNLAHRYRRQLLNLWSRVSPAVRRLVVRALLALGTASGAITGPVGPMVGAVLAFASDWIINALGGTVKVVIKTIIAVVLFFLGSFLLLVLFIWSVIAIIAGNVKFPWEISAVVPPPITLTKSVCKQEINAPDCDNFQPALTLPKGGAGESYQVHWRVSVKNTSGEELKGATISDDRCNIKGKLDLAPGAERIFPCPGTTSIPADKDDVVTNIATFVADASTSSTGAVIPARFQRTAASVIVGSPAIGCFDFSGIFDPGESALVTAEAAALTNFSPAYTAFLCSGGPIYLKRNTAVDYSFAPAATGNEIYFGNDAFLVSTNLLFALGHESGHIYMYRNGRTYSNFCRQVFGRDCTSLDIGVGAIAPGEGYLRTYPPEFDRSPFEDFAEMVGVYLVGGRCPRCGTLDLQSEYPKHFDFAKRFIFERRKGT